MDAVEHLSSAKPLFEEADKAVNDMKVAGQREDLVLFCCHFEEVIWHPAVLRWYRGEINPLGW